MPPRNQSWQSEFPVEKYTSPGCCCCSIASNAVARHPDCRQEIWRTDGGVSRRGFPCRSDGSRAALRVVSFHPKSQPRDRSEL